MCLAIHLSQTDHVTKSQYRCICSECVLLKILLHDRNIIYLSTPLIPKLFFLEFYCPRAFYGNAMCFIIVAEWYINYIVIVSLNDSGPLWKKCSRIQLQIYFFCYTICMYNRNFFPFHFLCATWQYFISFTYFDTESITFGTWSSNLISRWKYSKKYIYKRSNVFCC